MLKQKKPLNFITLGPRGTDNINKMKTLTDQTRWLANYKKATLPQEIIEKLNMLTKC
jgi:hypothetical protein